MNNPSCLPRCAWRRQVIIEPQEEVSFLLETTPVYFPTFCPWCKAEGLTTRTGFSVIENSHKVCVRHNAEMEAKIMASRKASNGG